MDRFQSQKNAVNRILDHVRQSMQDAISPAYRQALEKQEKHLLEELASIEELEKKQEEEDKKREAIRQSNAEANHSDTNQSNGE